MKVQKIILGYPDGDRIILHKDSDLEKYDLSKCNSYEITLIMSPKEFELFQNTRNGPICPCTNDYWHDETCPHYIWSKKSENKIDLGTLKEKES